jgi:AcrR family transcriptional regulator
MARAKDRGKPVQIIDAAFSVFGETGFEATRMQSIAQKAGLSSGTIYTYFRDKKDLFRATAQEGWDRFLGQIEDLAESPKRAEARLASFLDIGFGSLKRYLPLLRGMLFESSQMRILQENLERFCSLVERLLPAEGARARRGSDHNGRGALSRRTEAAALRRRTLIRLTVVGVLFSAALAEPERTDQEIEALKRSVMAMLSGG